MLLLSCCFTPEDFCFPRRKDKYVSVCLVETKCIKLQLSFHPEGMGANASISETGECKKPGSGLDLSLQQFKTSPRWKPILLESLSSGSSLSGLKKCSCTGMHLKVQITEQGKAANFHRISDIRTRDKIYSVPVHSPCRAVLLPSIHVLVRWSSSGTSLARFFHSGSSNCSACDFLFVLPLKRPTVFLQ